MKTRTKVIIGVLGGFVLIGAVAGGNETDKKNETKTSTTTIGEWMRDAIPLPDLRPLVDNTTVSSPTTTTTIQDSLTVSQENAVRKAESYVELMPFSRSGLIDQLKYEGYSPEDSTFAVDSLNVDWNGQAVKKAESYLELMPFSYSGLIDQLKYEGFTQEQAEYGVSRTGL